MKEVIQDGFMRFVLFLSLILYITGIIPAFNPFLANIFANPVVQLLLLLGAIQVSYHDLTLSLLMTVALLISIGCCTSYTNEIIPWWHKNSEPIPYNDDPNCDGLKNGLTFQCQGVNTFGYQYNTQGLGLFPNGFNIHTPRFHPW